MNKCLKETFQVIRLEGGNIVLFELIYRMISLPIYLQLLDRAVHFSLDRAGYSYITNENIVDYLAKPWTFICLAGLMAAAFILLMIEAAGLSGAFQAAAYHRKLSALLIFEAGLVQLKEEAEKRNWKLFLMVFIQYFLFNMFFLYRLFSHMRPVSFIMKELFEMCIRDSTFIDFGDDQFTQGKPHPMIEPSLRLERIVKEARDPEVGVIALDIILGYGSHEDPVEVTLPAIREAKAIAEKEGRHIEILGFVLGTELDPQNFDLQVKKLMDAGVTISSSSENTGLLSRGFVEKEEA